MSVRPPKLIENFREIEIKKPADIIIQQIKNLIATDVMKPGDRLPAERAFAEKFGVGRGHVREALKRLEFYGILRTLPQSGTYVASLGTKALEGLIAHVLELEKEDLDSLLETRRILEVNAARLAAERATPDDLLELIRTHKAFRRQVRDPDAGVSEDHLFHLKVAECAKNTVLRSLITLITPDIIAISNKNNTCRDGRAEVALKEHEAILQAITQKNPGKAARAMEVHMAMALKQFER